MKWRRSNYCNECKRHMAVQKLKLWDLVTNATCVRQVALN